MLLPRFSSTPSRGKLCDGHSSYCTRMQHQEGLLSNTQTSMLWAACENAEGSAQHTHAHAAHADNLLMWGKCRCIRCAYNKAPTGVGNAWRLLRSTTTAPEVRLLP
mmetsp:Transcript_17275/g.37269  ORF Transcript_17275/g.37269 Transcript_17275/m.37269 type:complete len:106 (-) Transcript_17275:2608-2925(-)